ncbi:WSC domain-containing protein [Annulohypoxylon truncatum]|uniref:WSC domain-containing protein n=1 Tax=Annulohypoxylon truncatum TaxID=327061 RepID=UPI002008B530|nr:WSC domain-containing protein [Annulohypoxylon truncatum]KAI1208701.1 WSC domain-containing protein [Annulohypoxylon truncatum]
MMFQLTSNFVVLALFASAAQSAYLGCFSSSTNLSFKEHDVYQSLGQCQQVCKAANLPILATTKGTDCFCGAEAPPQSDAVADSSCNTPCSGYAEDKCGGEGFFSVSSL